MATEPKISLVCFGLIGTLISDEGLVQQSFAEAIATQGVVSGTSAYARRMAQVHRVRGRSPRDIFRALFPDNEARAQAAELAFDQSLAGAMSRSVSRPVPGARDLLDGLGKAGCRLGVMTNLSGRVLDRVLTGVGWRNVFDVALSSDDVERGCPAPDYALTAMLRLGVGDVRELAMVQDTGAAVECGRRAGASFVVGVLSGPHSVARLRSAGATHIIAGIGDLPALLAPAQRAGPREPGGGEARGAEDRNGAAVSSFALPVNMPPQAPLGRDLGAAKRL
jgi:phosphoglycolate phosphatase